MIINWLKYCCIIMVSTITRKTVLSMFGDTWMVYGNVVQKISY